MWVLKTHGQTYYVNHVDCRLPWSTKETPDNPHTKGSIKIKNALLTIDHENSATLTELTAVDAARIRNREKGITRIVIKERWIHEFKTALETHNIKHSPFKAIGGACSSTFYVTDIHKKADFTLLSLKLSHTDFRELMPNEGYYKWYDDPKHANDTFIDEDIKEWDESVEEDDDV